MGRFSGMLIVSDIDGTLFNSNREVSDENRRAILSFTAQGGRFTVATGRIPKSVRRFLPYDLLNAPAITHNGGALFDFAASRYLYQAALDKDALQVVEYVMQRLPFVGVEIYQGDDIYVCRSNITVDEHIEIEKFHWTGANVTDVPKPWTKVIFVQEAAKTPLVIQTLRQSTFKDRYTFSKSSSKYYEMLSIGADKGSMLHRLCDILHIPLANTVALGDNENDASLLRAAGTGFAVSNAKSEAKAAADAVTVSNNEHAVAQVIGQLALL